MHRTARLSWGIFVLRLGLGLFLALWAVDKLMAPDHAVARFSHFYITDITPSIAMIIGGLELVLSLLIILGMSKTWTYGLGLILFLIFTLSTYRELINPFGANYLYLTTIPILFAFFALFLLRDFDTKLSLGKKKSIFR